MSVRMNQKEKKSPLESFSPSSAIEVGVVCVVRAFFSFSTKTSTVFSVASLSCTVRKNIFLFSRFNYGLRYVLTQR